ncbi:ribonuclease H-like domain, reverse transcriptase, RNA-dependent DNA polymerase [Tanacetum coccineum]
MKCDLRIKDNIIKHMKWDYNEHLHEEQDKNHDMNSDVLTAEIDDTITMDDTNNITAISSPVIELSLTEELEKQVTEPTSDGRPEYMVKDTNDMLHMVQVSTLQDDEKRVSFATVVVTENTHKKVNFRKVEEDVASNVDYESMIPMSFVVKVNERLSNTIYGYFIGKRVAFPVVENYVYNAWGKFGIQKVMYAKGFYFFKFSSTKGVDDVLENGPWMIRQVPIILNTWSTSTSLTKETHSSVPIWVKMHDVPMAAFTDDGLSFIASKTRNPLMLDLYTSTMCNESWGRSSYARAMIEVHANVELKESILVAVPKLEGNGYTCETVTGEYEWKPPRCSTCKIFGHMLDQCPHTVKEIMPIKKVEREMDGFQLVKDRNAGRKTTDKSYGVKTKKNLVYRPVSKANVSSSPKTNVASSSKQLGLSKYVDLESKKKGTVDLDSDDDVENCYDETAGFMENDMMVQRGQALPICMVPMYSIASWNIRVDIGILERVFSKVCSKWEWTSNASHCRKGSRIILGWNDEAVDVTVLDCSSQVIHTQIMLKADNSEGQKPKPFKFFNFLSYKPEFQQVLTDQWGLTVNRHNMFRLVKRLRGMKKPLRKLLHAQGAKSEGDKPLKNKGQAPGCEGSNID